ncbi:unnamed protein product [Fusarium graminearum]|nr:unnamed protein product [Fusarium graminearum]
MLLIPVRLRGDGTAGLETRGNVQHVGDLVNATVDAERQETGSKTGAVAEETNSLALKILVVDNANQTGETTPDATTVHVTAVGGDLDGGVDTLLEALLGEGHEGLLNNLVGQGLLVVHVTELRSDLSEDGRVGVGEVVVVEETSVRLLDKLASGRVESHVVETVEAGLGRGIAVGDTVGAIGLLGLTLAVSAVGGIESLAVAVDGVVAINVGVLAGDGEERDSSKLTLAIVAEAHLGLAKANGVLSGANAIELLKLDLINILKASKIVVSQGHDEKRRSRALGDL